MKPAAAVVDAGEIAVVQRVSLQKIENQPVYRSAFHLHQVKDQAVSPRLIGVKQPTGDIKPPTTERLPTLPFQDTIGVVERGVERIYGPTGSLAGADWDCSVVRKHASAGAPDRGLSSPI